MKQNIELIPLQVMKDAPLRECIMSSLKKEDSLTYCICSFMLLTGSDLKNTLLLTYEQLYMPYENHLVPVSLLCASAGSRLVYLDKECGLFTALTEELSDCIMQEYTGVMADYVFSAKGSRTKAINRSFMTRKISNYLEKFGFSSSPSLFKNTFGYLYFCKYRTLIGTPFSYLCYRKEQIMKTFSLTESEYQCIMDTGFCLDEEYLIADISDKIRSAHACLRLDEPGSTAATKFLEELHALATSFKTD